MAPTEVRLEANGRVLLPAEVRRALGVHPGDTLLLEVGAEGVLLWTRDMAARGLQGLVSHAVPAGTSLVDELSKLRRTYSATLDALATKHHGTGAHGEG